MKNTVVGGVITLNDTICKPATTHDQGMVIFCINNPCPITEMVGKQKKNQEKINNKIILHK